MKVRHLLIVGLIAVFSMVCSQAAFAKERIVFGGGPAGGTFQVVANAIQVYDPIKELPDIRVQAQSSAGSVENLRKTDALHEDNKVYTNKNSYIKSLSLVNLYFHSAISFTFSSQLIIYL